MSIFDENILSGDVKQAAAEQAAEEPDAAAEIVENNEPEESVGDASAKVEMEAEAEVEAGNGIVPEEDEPVETETGVDEEAEAEDGTDAEAEPGTNEEDEPGADDEAEVEEEAETEPPVKKNRWTKVSTIVVVVAAVLILGMLGFLGWHEGWFEALRPKAKNACTLGDYSKIEVLRSEVEVTDEMVDNFIDSLVADYPGEEFSDSWAQTYAADILNRQDITDVQGFREYAYDYIHDYLLHNSMMVYLRSITEVKSYDEEKKAELMAYSGEGLGYYASMYGVDPEVLAAQSGFASAEEYEANEAENYLTSIMMLDKIMKEKKLSYTAEDVDAEMLVYMNINGLSMYTLDQFKELSGETWCYLFEYIQFRSNLVMSAIEDNVVYLEDTPE